MLKQCLLLLLEERFVFGKAQIEADSRNGLPIRDFAVSVVTKGLQVS